MGKPKTPKAPDPQKVAAAQTAQNVGTAIAQSSLDNTNQVTPDGSLTYSQTGTTQWTDPNSGKVYEIPQYTATQTLSEMGQQIHDQQNQAKLNMASLGANQSARLDGLLSGSMGREGLPERADIGAIGAPNYQGFGNTGISDAGKIQKRFTTNIANAGAINRDFSQSIADAGPVGRMGGDSYGAQRDLVTQTLLDRNQGNVDRDRSRLESRLASQGIRIGSDAYKAAMGDHSRSVNDSRMAAILAGGQEQSRLAGLDAQRTGVNNAAQAQQFGQSAQSAAFDRAGIQLGNQAQSQQFGQNAANAELANRATQLGNQAQSQQFGQNKAVADHGRQGIQLGNALETQKANAALAMANAQNANRSAALQEEFAYRNQPINEITALMSGSQVRNPNFVNTPAAQIANTDVAGIHQNNYAQQLQAYNQQMSGWNNIWGGLLGGGIKIATGGLL